MKVICVDNYDRPGYVPYVVESNLTKREAEDKADYMNSVEDDMSENYYLVVEDGWEHEGF